VKLDDRFDALARTRAPDLWPDIAEREPHSSSDGGPSGLRRVGIAILALTVAAAGFAYAFRTFEDRRGPGSIGVGPSPAQSVEPAESLTAVNLRETDTIDVGQGGSLVFGDGSIWVVVLRDAETGAGTVLRIDAETGHVQAEIPVDAFSSWELGGGAMAFDGSSVWIGSPVFEPGEPDRGVVVRIDSSTNQAETIQLDGYRSVEDLMFDGGSMWVIATPDGGGNPEILELDRSTGSVVAHVPFEAEWWRSVISIDGTLWTSQRSVKDSTVGDPSLVRLDPTTGAKIVSVPTVDADGFSVFAEPVAGSDVIWAPAGGEILGIDPLTGDVIDRFSADIGFDIAAGSDGSVWALGRDRLERFDPATGESDASVPIPHGC